MGFLESVIARIGIGIFNRVLDFVLAKVDTTIVYQKIYEKHDQLKNEMATELAQANTDEERDAILSKIYNSRPTFN